MQLEARPFLLLRALGGGCSDVERMEVHAVTSRGGSSVSLSKSSVVFNPGGVCLTPSEPRVSQAFLPSDASFGSWQGLGRSAVLDCESGQWLLLVVCSSSRLLLRVLAVASSAQLPHCPSRPLHSKKVIVGCLCPGH